MLPRNLAILLALAATAAGCVNAPAPDDVEAASVEGDADLPMAGPATEEIAGDIQASAATPVRSVNYGGAFSNVIEVQENTTGYVFELEWTAATPASEELSIWVRPAGVGNIPPEDPAEFVATSPPLGQADGASPLRIAMPFDAFGEAGEYEVVVRASAAPIGVAANQPFTLYVTSFTDVPFDDAFSALAGEDSSTA